MALLQWSDGFDFGCLDFPGHGQMIGRDCFPGSPAWLPRKLFEIYQLKGVWMIYPCDHAEWINLSIRTPRTPWAEVDVLPSVLLDDSMLRVDYDGRIIKLMFHDRGSSCENVSHAAGLWQSRLWLSAQSIEDAENEAIATHQDKLWAYRLNWLAEYLEEHTWAAVAAITLVLGGLVYGGHLSFPLPSGGESEEVRK